MNSSNPEPQPQEPALILAAERIVSQALGRSTRFASLQLLTDPDSNSTVYRCFAAPGSEPPATFILKKAADTFRVENPEAREAQRFLNDWVGVEFLSSIPTEAPISPRFYGGDLRLGCFVLEDLGEHHSLVEPLLHGQAAAAEATLMKYSACLGRLHAMTAGKAGAFEGLFAARLPGAKPFAYEPHELEGRMKKVEALLEPLEVPWNGALAAEIQAVTDAVWQPGPFRVYLHADACPDNDFDLGDRICLIDFETGHFGHALLDGVYPRMIWPSCWCANRLPGEIVTRMENRYLAELVKGCPAAQEDEIWETALVQMCGFTLLNTLNWHLETALKEDHEWGIASLRQRVVARLEAFCSTAEEFHRLPALRGAASRLLPLLQARWPNTPPLPHYPAFNSSAQA